MSSDAARLLPAAALTAAVGLPVRVFTVFEIRGGLGFNAEEHLTLLYCLEFKIWSGTAKNINPFRLLIERKERLESTVHWHSLLE